MRALRDLSNGPPPALPAVFDRVAERWAGAPPRLRWAVVAATVVICLAVVGRGAVSSPWGPPVPVLVAATDLPPGTEISGAHVTTATWPRSLAEGAARSAEQVVGAVTTARISTGQPIRLDTVHDGGLATALAPDHAAVAVRDAAATSVTPGWRVDVVGPSLDGGSQILARDARVLAVDADQVWLEVRRGDAPAVLAASARGDANLVLLPPG